MTCEGIVCSVAPSVPKSLACLVLLLSRFPTFSVTNNCGGRRQKESCIGDVSLADTTCHNQQLGWRVNFGILCQGRSSQRQRKGC